MRFYLGTMVIAGRADLTPAYRMIFRRLEASGADWEYCFPELYMVELGPPDDESQAARLRADVADANARAKESAMDQPPPGIVEEYRQVFGRNPKGWPPA